MPREATAPRPRNRSCLCWRLSRKSEVAAVDKNGALRGEFSAGAAVCGRRRRLRRPLWRVGGA
jgi:hypothetical protein